MSLTNVNISHTKFVLSNALNIILTPWPALVMAIENSFGGPYTRDKAEWLKGVIADYLLSKKLVDLDDLESYIISIMESEFNTLVEDGSCSKLCGVIIRIYSAIQGNDNVEVEQILSPFRKLNSHKTKPASPVTQSVSVSHQEFDTCHKSLPEPMEMGIDTPQEISVDLSRSSPATQSHEYMEQSDEWQIVTRSKRKKKSFPH